MLLAPDLDLPLLTVIDTAGADLSREAERAAEIARAQGVDVAALHAAGLIDHSVDEGPDAAAEPRDFCARMGRSIEYELGRARAIPDAERLHLRRLKFARLGH